MAYVLIVEDDKDLAWGVSQVLGLEGYESAVAACGDDAIRLLEARCPDLVVTDVEMPALDSEGLGTRMFLEECGKENIPILVVSGLPEVERIARRIGTPYFSLKPFDFDEFLSLISKVLAERISPRPRALAFPAKKKSK